MVPDAGRERARVLRRVADGIRRRGDELAAVESIDVGKPITLSRAVDVNTVVEQYEYHAALAQTLDGAARAIPLPPTRTPGVRRSGSSGQSPRSTLRSS